MNTESMDYYNRLKQLELKRAYKVMPQKEIFKKYASVNIDQDISYFYKYKHLNTVATDKADVTFGVNGNNHYTDDSTNDLIACAQL